MAAFIKFIMFNFTLTFFVLGMLIAAIQIFRTPAVQRTTELKYETVFKWFLLFSVGASYFYNFIVHTFFGEVSAHFIGWANSPFQLEVGFASLGYAVVGFIAFRKNWWLRLAAVVGPGLFMLGAAGGHVYQMIVAHNFAPGNAGIMFYSDIFLPLFGLLMLWLTRRQA
ncbi:DUF6790 family protein [Zwartia sp.]|uniref:DUF6790 family protein n=1 Tax=Zwartia sp. TaxID=2978004 RepID=UPI0027249FDD|nr:DUF6790 family protein [Zwartia sp.]MDO9025380.1 hypothetical protein [Zwartia sp.]